MPQLLFEDVKELVIQMSGYNNPCKPILIVDSFEHLCEGSEFGALSTVGELVKRLTHIQDTLWIVAGRYRLGEGWDNVVHYPIELVGVDEQGTREILASRGINDHELAGEIHRFSGGLPLFIILCVDALEQNPEKDLRLSFNHLVRTHATREKLLRHFVTGLDDDMEIAVYAMSYLHEWDEDTLARLLSLNNLMDYDVAEIVAEDVPRLSFVTPRMGRYQMHERIAALLRSITPETLEIRRAFRKLFKNMRLLLSSVKDDKTLRAEDSRYLRLTLNRGLWEMSIHGDLSYGRMSSDDLFQIRVEYIQELYWARRPVEAIATINKMLPLYKGQIEQTIRLSLFKSANLTQRWLRTDDISYHKRSIEIERKALTRIKESGSDSLHELYIISSNSLGLSLMRIAETLSEICESLEYLRPNYLEMKEKDILAMSKANTNCLNNYGLACLRAYELSEVAASKNEFLLEALNAFALAVEAREIVFSPTHVLTLKTITNKGIAFQRLGRLRDARDCFELANTRFEQSGYAKGQSEWLYNRYHLAILMEDEAREARHVNDQTRALALLQIALGSHEEVLRDRRRFNDGAQAIRKSLDRIVECRKQLDEMGF